MPDSASRLSPARALIMGLLVLAGAAAFAAAHKAPVSAQTIGSMEGVTEYQLPNGLQVLLYPDEAGSTVSINVTYKVGSRHESYGETGMAHLLEHMNFKGTPSHPKIDDELSSRGGQANATTAYARTNYFETLPASTANREWALGMHADRMNQSFIGQKNPPTQST